MRALLNGLARADRSLASALVLLLLLLVAAVLNTAMTIQQRNDAQWVTHTHEVLDTLHGLRGNLSEARVAIRGYTLMGREDELATYRGRVARAKTSLERFAVLTADNPQQQWAARAIAVHLASLESIWERSLAVFEAQGSAAALQMFRDTRGQSSVNEAYAEIERAEERERTLLSTRDRTSVSAYRLSLWAAVVSGLASVLLVGMYLWALRRNAVQAADISEKLREADRQKDRFIAVLAHELRNPLAPVRTACEILTHKPDGATVEWAVNVMRRQVSHMAVLLDDLLDVARITQGRLVLNRRVVSLQSVVAVAVEASMPAIDARKHTLVIEEGDGDADIDVDSVRIAQVITNLLNNAARYSDPGRRITLAIRRSASDVCVTVRDEGIGIEPAEHRKIFRMFEQVDARDSRSQGGLGVGLALSRAIVELHGGSVSVKSEGRGKGSEFAIVLPRVIRNAARAAG